MKVSDEKINLWAKPLSETEDAKCVNAREQVTTALRNKFGNSVRIFLQGSYANNTNVRQDSDVDIVVLHEGYYFPDVSLLQPHEQQTYWSTFSGSTYTFSQFRDEVHSALLAAFPGSIEPKEKCLKVNGNTTRMQADVVASFEHHRFATPTYAPHKGIAFNTKSGTRIESFPEQHLAIGKTKNDNTGRAYKQMVRIIKNVLNDFSDKGMTVADPMSSFFIECLVWNVPDLTFNGTTYREVARNVIAKIWNDMRTPETANNYLEVSNLHWLFRGQPRTPAQAEAFMLQAWNYLEP